MSDNVLTKDWTECLLYVDKTFLVKETEKAWCFKLWGRVFTVIPKGLIRKFNVTTTNFEITIPKFFLDEEEHKQCRYLLDKEIRQDLYPSKRQKKSMPLLQPEILNNEIKEQAEANQANLFGGPEKPEWM